MMQLEDYLLSIFIFLVIFSSISAGDWQNIGGDLSHSGYAESSYIPLELVWNYSIGHSEISAPIIDRGTLYIGSDDNNLYALDAATGKLKWRYSTFGRVYTPTANNGLVYAASFDNNIYAIDSTGNLRWKTNTGNSIASPPVIYNNMLYGGFDKFIYSIYIVNGTIKWRYATDGLIESAPAISQGILYVGSDDSKIYALDAGNKNLRWSYKTGGSITSLSVVNGILYAGSRDNRIYAIDSIDGTLEWNKKTNNWIRSAPAVSENKIYAGSDDYSIYAFDIENGDILWKYQTNGRIQASPIVANGVVYAGSEDGTVYTIETESGTLIDKYEVGSGIISLALSDNMLFATSRNGYVYAFGAYIPQSTRSPPVMPDMIPPELRVDNIPVNYTTESLTVSGTAYDPSGILVVTVNGINAGTETWKATLTLSKGTNIITIVAVDKAGNIKTEVRTVEYSPPAVIQETPLETPAFSSFSGIILIIAIVILRKVI